MPRQRARSVETHVANEPRPLTTPADAKRDLHADVDKEAVETDAVTKFIALRERQRHTEEQMRKLDKLKTKGSMAEREKLEEVHKRIGAEMKELGDHKELSAEAEFRETHPLKDWKFRKDEWQPTAAAEMQKILDEDPEAAKAMKGASKRKQEAPEEFEIDEGDVLESKDDTAEAEQQFFGSALESGRMPLASSKGEEGWSSRERTLYEPLKAKYDSLARYANGNDKQFEQVKADLGFTWEDLMNAPEEVSKKKLKKGEKAPKTKLELIKKLEGVHRELVHFPMKKAASHTEISAEEALKKDRQFRPDKGTEEKRGPDAKQIAEAKEKTQKHRKLLEAKKASGGQVTRLIDKPKGEPSREDTNDEDVLRRKYMRIGPRKHGFIWKEFQTATGKERARMQKQINKLYREEEGDLPPMPDRGPLVDEGEAGYEVIEETQVIPGREMRAERSLQQKYDALAAHASRGTAADRGAFDRELGFTWSEFQRAGQTKRKGLFAGLGRFLSGQPDLTKKEMTKRIDDAYAKMTDGGRNE